MKRIYMLVSLVFAMACGHQGGDGHGAHGEGHAHHGDANAHMHSRPIEDLIARFEDPARAEWQKPEEVFRLMGDIQGQTVMEIGAGSGYFSFMALEKGARVIAADIDDRFLDYIQQKRDSLGIAADMMEIRQIQENSPGFRPGEADLVFMVNVYHHIENRQEYFAMMAERLVEGGRLMVVDFIREDTEHGPPTEMRLSADEVKAELSAAGFRDIRVHSEVLPEQYVIFASM